MKNFIHCGCECVETDKKSNLYLELGTDSLSDLVWAKRKSEDGYNVHLYITSDEKPKKGDYVYCLVNCEVIKVTDVDKLGSFHSKIIASTDKSLNLLKIPQEFIVEYIKSWNTKHKAIENVLVECEHDLGNDEDDNGNLIPVKKIKRNDQREITIKSAKNKWNKVELKEVLDKISPEYSKLEDFDPKWDDVKKIEWGMQKAYNHDATVIVRWIKENL